MIVDSISIGIMVIFYLLSFPRSGRLSAVLRFAFQRVQQCEDWRIDEHRVPFVQPCYGEQHVNIIFYYFDTNVKIKKI